MEEKKDFRLGHGVWRKSQGVWLSYVTRFTVLHDMIESPPATERCLDCEIRLCYTEVFGLSRDIVQSAVHV